MTRVFVRGVMIAVPAFVLAISGCEGLQDDRAAGLFGKATHTGTASLYRADRSGAAGNVANSEDTRVADDRYAGQRGRFTALREKGDYAGLDTSDRTITADDTITLTLNGGFIKYFREEGGDTRKGEIALVLSFDAGIERAVTEEDAILIYSSQGQTLGSFLDLTDWKILGPMVVDGDSLRLRVVMIEWDQQENEQRKGLVRAVAATAANFVPGVGGHLEIASSLANFIIDQNRDDVIVDQRFALQRVQAGGLRIANPLLAGTYVLMLQEDSLANVEVAGTRAALPPVINELRFDRHSGLVYKRYDFVPGLTKEDNLRGCGAPNTSTSETAEVYDLTYGAVLYPGRSWIGLSRVSYNYEKAFEDKMWHQNPPTDDSLRYKQCVLEHWINGETALGWRRNVLGYREPFVGELELLSSLDAALHEAIAEGIRHTRVKPAQEATPQVIQRLLLESGFDPAKPERPFALPYNYKVSIYPKAYVVMAEYPLHTHLVFTIEYSLGGIGDPYHRQFARYLEVLEKEKLRARENTRLERLTDQIEAARRAMARQGTVFSQVDKLSNDQVGARACMLLPLLNVDDDDNMPLSNADVYNKLFHVTGEFFDDSDGFAAFLNGKGCEVSAGDFTCSCPTEPSELAPEVTTSTSGQSAPTAVTHATVYTTTLPAPSQ
ncbi:MAG: hypothetical protein OXG16_09000 [Rhodospirillales bacterium]|nr:hypothetical protein [Rhodospirillales bacterium]